jgi:hypothetical protein
MAHPRMTHHHLFDHLAVADRDQLKSPRHLHCPAPRSSRRPAVRSPPVSCRAARHALSSRVQYQGVLRSIQTIISTACRCVRLETPRLAAPMARHTRSRGEEEFSWPIAWPSVVKALAVGSERDRDVHNELPCRRRSVSFHLNYCPRSFEERECCLGAISSRNCGSSKPDT